MTIRQLYYTSCRHGTEGIQGFQVNAVTPGLDRAHVDTGLQLSLYRPPPSAPSLPTAEQLEQLPVAVGYRHCGDYAVLFHSRYLGADFTGRQGNYFAHILVLDSPDRDLAGALPVEAWRGAGWRWTPADGTELAVLHEVPRGGLRDWTPGGHLRAGYLPEFAELLTGIQEALQPPGGKVVLVAPTDEAAARAVAAVTRSLPRALATAVSFITFTSAPADADVLVAGTSPDVTIPISPLGDQSVVRLGGSGSGADVSRYARALERCWLRSDDEAEEAVTLASSIQPPVQASELEGLAHLIELIVPDSVRAVPDLDVLEALEFGLRRWPAVLRAPVWARVAELTHAGLPGADPARWSSVIRNAHEQGNPVPPALMNAYLKAVLTGVISAGLDPATIWMPERLTADHQRTALGWAATTLERKPSFPVASAVLDTLARVRVGLPDETVRHLASCVVVPRLLDPETADDAAAELGRLAKRAPTLPDRVCQELESVIAEPGGLRRVATMLPIAAAGLLVPHAARASRCAQALDVVQARAGTRGPVTVLARALRGGGASPEYVEMFVDLLWPELPSAADAVALCRAVTPGLLARTKIPGKLTKRLVADAEGAGLSADDLALADELGVEQVAGSLGAGRWTVQAVRYVGYFGSRPKHVDQVIDVAVRAVDNTAGEVPALRKAAMLTLAAWVCTAPDAIAHTRVLDRLLNEAHHLGEFVGAYRVELTAVLRDGRAAAVAAVLPALAVLGTRHRDIQQMLDKTAAIVLTGRSKRARDGITKEIGGADRRLRPLLKQWKGRAPKSWPVWWDDWQQAHLRTSLMSRLLARRRTAKAVD